MGWKLPRKTTAFRRTLHMEGLEDRRVMAVLFVTSLDDMLIPGTLRQALVDANGNGQADTIQFSVSGTINLMLGQLGISSDVTIDGSGGTVTIDGGGLSRIFSIDDGDGAANRNVSISNLTIRGGRVANVASPNSGGGIRNAENLTLNNVTISGNHAATGGGLSNANGGTTQISGSTISNNTAYYQAGGIANLNGASIQITNCTISGNSAGTTNQSGYSSFGGGLLNSGTLTLVSSIVTANTVSHTNLATYGAFGGGISSSSGAITTIRQSTISGNTGELGGAIHAGAGSVYLRDTILGGTTQADGNRGSRGAGVFVSGSLNMIGGSIRNNRTINLGGASELGGGVSVGPNASASFDGVGLLNNSTTGRGGAIYMSTYGGAGTSSVTIRNSTISGNTAGDLGGGISAGSGSLLLVDDSDIDNNVAENRGGGIYASTLGVNVPTSVTVRNNSNLRNNLATRELGGGMSFGSRVTATVESSTISGNTADDRGGGIYVAAFGSTVPSVLTITDSILADNRALTLIGGGISQGPNVTSTITRSTLRDNDANTRGGGMFVSGFGNVLGTRVTLNDSTISGNIADELGGGMSIGSNATAKIYGSMISDNETLTRGGGIYASTYGALGQSVGLTIKDTIISGNIAQTLGGGMNTGSQVTLNVERTRFLNNQANGSGGAAYISGFWDTGTMSFPLSNTRIVDSTFDSNRAITGDGGAIRMGRTTSFEVSGSTFSNNETLGFDGGAFSFGNAKLTTITNSTFSGNRALNDGGAIWADIDPAAPTPTGPQVFRVNFSTITGNQADSDLDQGGYGGGGLLVSNGGVEIRNSIISGNSDGGGAIPDFADVLYNANVSHSLIESSAGHAVANGVLGNLVGVSAALGPLAENGGPTKTHLPSFGSPALNTADPASTLLIDQRGMPRPAGTGFDMGAVERALMSVDGDFNDDGNYTCQDVNALSTAIATSGPVALFDLTGDGQLTLADLTAWLSEAGANNLGPGRAYKNGDANLDSVVDGSDFGIWNSNKFTANTNWCSGNFNADQVVDGSDFGIWNSNKFTSADQSRAVSSGLNALTRLSPAERLGDRSQQKSSSVTEAKPADSIRSENGMQSANPLLKSVRMKLNESGKIESRRLTLPIDLAKGSPGSTLIRAKSQNRELALVETNVKITALNDPQRRAEVADANLSRTQKLNRAAESRRIALFDAVFSKFDEVL
jgi:predicted outer membrane repeat protein